MATYAQPRAEGALLRRVFQADSLICLLSGGVMAAGAGQLAPLLGIPAAALVAIGLFLVIYGGLLGFAASRPAIGRRAAWAAIVLDALWVVDSVVLLAGGWLPLTPVGWWLVVAQAVAVAGIAELKYLGLRRALQR